MFKRKGETVEVNATFVEPSEVRYAVRRVVIKKRMTRLFWFGWSVVFMNAWFCQYNIHHGSYFLAGFSFSAVIIGILSQRKQWHTLNNLH